MNAAVVRSDLRVDPTPASPQCRLLSLPRELRDHIWKLSLLPENNQFEFILWETTKGSTTDGPFDVYARQHHHRYGVHVKMEQPSLTRTCRQIRNGTLPVHYGSFYYRFEVVLHPQARKPPPNRTLRWKYLVPKYMHMMKYVYFATDPYRLPHLPIEDYAKLEAWWVEKVLRKWLQQCDHVEGASIEVLPLSARLDRIARMWESGCVDLRDWPGVKQEFRGNPNMRAYLLANLEMPSVSCAKMDKANDMSKSESVVTVAGVDEKPSVQRSGGDQQL